MQEERKQQMQSTDVDALRKKTMIVKIIVACLALGCVILVIVVLSKSSVYFGSMFTLDTEFVIKAYLRLNYTSMTALLYLSIFGFVIAIADTILLFFKFTQKAKLLWFHVGYYLAFLICGCVALTNKDYNSYMNGLSGQPLVSPACTTGVAFPLQCALVPSYLSYHSTVTLFFIIFNIFFVAFAALYHYAAAILMPFETEVSKPEPIKTTVFNPSGNNETFVSQMNDDYV